MTARRIIVVGAGVVGARAAEAVRSGVDGEAPEEALRVRRHITSTRGLNAPALNLNEQSLDLLHATSARVRGLLSSVVEAA